MKTEYRIHPAIGVARVGDNDGTAPDDYFLGPEAPGPTAPPEGGYKKVGRVKRQGARFRIFEYGTDPAGRKVPMREITEADARIEWTVTLANRKAVGAVFPPGNTVPPTPGVQPRNADIVGAAERERLLVLQASGTVAGPGADPARLEAFFLDRAGDRAEGNRVRLGDLLTDADGHLIVLGGLGRSFSPEGRPLNPNDTFNHDGWCDDTSDGIVTARVTPHDQSEALETAPARILVGPPDYAPALGNLVSLYDVAEDVATRLPPEAGPLPGPDEGDVSFARHIYPILERTARIFWVTSSADVGHGPNRGGNFLRPDLLPLLRDPNPDEASVARIARLGVLQRLRVPEGVVPPDEIGNLPRNMPRLLPELDTGRPLTLTPLQYGRMIRWWRGDFDPDAGANLDSPLPLDAITEPAARAEALDRASLDACVGGSFYPGIEASRLFRETAVWDAPFRIAAGVPAGALTEGMSLPWQTDFLACSQAWWPAQRPNQVHVPSVGGNLVRQEWARDSGGGDGFINSWTRMGFVVREGDAYVESERDEAAAGGDGAADSVTLTAAAAAGQSVGEAEWAIPSVLPAEAPLGDPRLEGKRGE